MADAGDVARMRRIIGRLQAAGVTVREMPGWETRGATWTRIPRGVVDHHDASTVKSGEWGSLGVILAGRPGIPPPLSQFQVARGLDGIPKVAICGAGRANHAGRGGPYVLPAATVPLDAGNSWMYGAEKANDGLREPYTVAGLYATVALFAAIADVCGVPRDSVIGHKEWAAGRKSDPVYRMWRAREETVAFQPGRLPTPPPGTPVTPVRLPADVVQQQPTPTPPVSTDEDDMVRIMNFGDGNMYVVDVGARTKWRVEGPGHLAWLHALGIQEVQGVQGGQVGDIFDDVDWLQQLGGGASGA